MNRRRGITLIEVIASAALLSVLLAVLGHLLTVVAMQRRASNRRHVAVEEAANVMEQLAVAKYDELQMGRPPEISLSNEAQQTLPAAALKIDVSPESTESPPGKRLTVELSWRNQAGQTNRPVRLVAWRYRKAVADDDEGP